jgi:hypothetical protein
MRLVRRFLRMSRWAWLAMFAAACAHSAPAARPAEPVHPAPAPAQPAQPHSPLADDIPQLALRARQLYFDWHTAFADDSLDCATATTRMNALADKNVDVLTANAEIIKNHQKAKLLRAELGKYEQEMEPVAKSIVQSPIMSRCSNDAAFGKAVDRLAGEQ